MVYPESHTLAVRETAGVPYYTFPSMNNIDFLKHGFSTRLGGVSKGIYQSMNLSFTRGDTTEAVTENFRLFCNAIGADYRNVVISAQEHHTNVRKVTAADKGKGIIVARDYTDVDGLMTNEPNIVLCTQYADCVPLFFVDPIRRVIATSHAGWKGTVAQIGAITVNAMAREYGCDPKDIIVGIGPSIGPCCFEVDEPVYSSFKSLAFLSDECITSAGNSKYYIDLWRVNFEILVSAGISQEHISVTDLCTKCHSETFWSHRITGDQRGSLAAFMMITEDI